MIRQCDRTAERISTLDELSQNQKKTIVWGAGVRRIYRGQNSNLQPSGHELDKLPLVHPLADFGLANYRWDRRRDNRLAVECTLCLSSLAYSKFINPGSGEGGSEHVPLGHKSPSTPMDSYLLPSVSSHEEFVLPRIKMPAALLSKSCWHLFSQMMYLVSNDFRSADNPDKSDTSNCSGNQPAGDGNDCRADYRLNQGIGKDG